MNCREEKARPERFELPTYFRRRKAVFAPENYAPLLCSRFAWRRRVILSVSESLLWTRLPRMRKSKMARNAQWHPSGKIAFCRTTKKPRRLRTCGAFRGCGGVSDRIVSFGPLGVTAAHYSLQRRCRQPHPKNNARRGRRVTNRHPRRINP